MGKVLVGVDIGGTSVKIAFLNYSGEILTKWEIGTDKSGQTIVADIAKAINEKLSEIGLSKNQLVGIGVGAPGPVDIENGYIYDTPNLGWKSYPLQKEFEAATGLKVIIENDANLAAIGEMWMGAGAGSKDLICVTLGTGVGGGIITNGEVIHGTNGAGGEFGHVTSIPEGGALCGCGKTGCIETIASATGIVRITKEALQSSSTESVLRDEDELSAKMVFDEAKNGDQIAKQTVEKVSFYLGLALANLANAVNPSKIVLGGGVSKAGDFLLNEVRANFAKFAFPRVLKGAEITIATLGNDAGVFGGAYLVKEKLT